MDAREAEALLTRIRRDAELLAARFDLRYRVIEAERPRVKRRYGVCYADGTIRIRLRHATSGEPLKYSSLVNTLCHELAHLRHFDHGLRFRRFYAQILEYARDQGLYQPRRSTGNERSAVVPERPRATPRPAQLPLFGTGGS
jgi:predicted metal-dependent hydrolase